MSKIFRSHRSQYFDSLTLLNIYPKFRFDPKTVSSSDPYKIVLFGLVFSFDRHKLIYQLVEKDYDVLELIIITEELFRYLNKINERGYVKGDALSDSFTVDIMKHLVSLGYEEKLLGNSEIPYTA